MIEYVSILLLGHGNDFAQFFLKDDSLHILVRDGSDDELDPFPNYGLLKSGKKTVRFSKYQTLQGIIFITIDCVKVLPGDLNAALAHRI